MKTQTLGDLALPPKRGWFGGLKAGRGGCGGKAPGTRFGLVLGVWGFVGGGGGVRCPRGVLGCSLEPVCGCGWVGCKAFLLKVEDVFYFRATVFSCSGIRCCV